MTGPLEHFMPVIAANRHRNNVGDPYFNYVSFLTEFHGRPAGYTGAGTDTMNVPRELIHNTPLFISGTPNRFPLASADATDPAPLGVSDIAAYRGDMNNALGSGIVAMDTSHIQLNDSDFEIRLKVACNIKPKDMFITGRWISGGTCWSIQYFYAMKRLRFNFTCNGSAVEYEEYPHFRMGDINDGVSEAEFFDGNFHEIVVTRTGRFISIRVDGMLGDNQADMFSTTTTSIYSPPNVPLAIGALPVSASNIRTGGACWRGLIKDFKIIISGTTQFHVDFNAHGDHQYWSMWWVGHYPQTKYPNALNLEGSPHEFQTDEGLIKESNYIGNYWPYDDELNLLGEDFTIEAFKVKFAHVNNKVQTIVGMGWSATKAWRLVVQNQGGNDTPGQLSFQYSLDGSSVITQVLMSGLTPGDVKNINISVSRVGSDLRGYIDGNRVFQTTISGNIADCAPNAIRLGFYANASNTDAANSDMKVLGFRLTKGYGRYRARTHRVPTLPLPKNIS